MSDELILSGMDHMGKVFILRPAGLCDGGDFLALKQERAIMASKAAALVMKLSITQHHNQF
jgi:hypothetical protein